MLEVQAHPWLLLVGRKKTSLDLETLQISIYVYRKIYLSDKIAKRSFSLYFLSSCQSARLSLESSFKRFSAKD